MDWISFTTTSAAESEAVSEHRSRNDISGSYFQTRRRAILDFFPGALRASFMKRSPALPGVQPTLGKAPP
jgi:hypothetical protein